MPADSVRLEIEFVRVPTSWEARLREFWPAVDEQHFELDLRRRLAENGLRCGLLSAQLPPVVRELLATEKPALEQLADGSTPEESELFANFRELVSRTGRPYKVVATPRSKERVVILVSDQQRLRAHEFSQPQGLLTLRTYPLGDGRVRLQLLPAIEHGELRQRIVPGQGSFMLDAGRDSHEFDLLRLEAVISPGETLILTSGDEPKGLGGWLFGGNPTQPRSVMLIRLAQTQYDDLFSDAPPVAPLATSLD